MDLTLRVYELTGNFPSHELYGLTSQMRRAAVSTASNIAEGSARSTRRDFRNFIFIARGSNAELQTQLMIAGRLGYCSQESMHMAQELAADVGRMLNGLSTYLKKEPPPIQGGNTNNDQLTTNN